MGDASRQVGSAVMWSVLARAGRFLLGLASSVIVVRGLGEYDYGVLSVVRTILTFAAIVAGAGMGQALLKFLPVLRVAVDREGAKSLVVRVIAVQTVVWVVLVAAAFLLGGRLESVFPFSGFADVLVVAIALAIFELYFTLIAHILNAHYDTKLLGAASIISHVIMIGCLLVLLPRGWGVVGVLIAAAAGHLGASAVLLRRVLGLFLRGWGEREDSSGIAGGRLLRFSLPFAAIGVLNVIVWRQSETLFLAHFHGAEVTGYFDLAYRLPLTMLEFVPGTVWPIIMAGISEVYAKDVGNLSRAIDKYYRMLFLLSAPICVFGFTLGGRMIPILFGEAMSPASLPTQLFFVIFTISIFAMPLSMSLYVIEKSHINFFIYLFLAAVNVGLDFLLIPRYGLYGAMIPVGLVIGISPFIYKRVVGRFVKEANIPYQFIVKCFLASSPMLLVLPFLGLVRGAWELAAAGLLCVALVVVGYKKARVLGDEELSLLASIPFPAAARLLRFMSS